MHDPCNFAVRQSSRSSRIEILDYSIIILLLHLDNGLIQIKIIIILIFEFFQIIVSEQDFDRVLDGDGYPLSSDISSEIHKKSLRMIRGISRRLIEF